LFEKGSRVQLVATIAGYPAGAHAVVENVVDRDVREILMATSGEKLLVLRDVLRRETVRDLGD
jgi:hypothetical protein